MGPHSALYLDTIVISEQVWGLARQRAFHLLESESTEALIRPLDGWKGISGSKTKVQTRPQTAGPTS